MNLKKKMEIQQNNTQQETQQQMRTNTHHTNLIVEKSPLSFELKTSGLPE